MIHMNTIKHSKGAMLQVNVSDWYFEEHIIIGILLPTIVLFRL